ncbi:pentatricopeptide repeat-containing protein At3g29290 [Hordeum vulgare subsp. vulgare]|uniref:Pentacotripeptide-repeat region of PRORP domain-containing protein n=1 Tax=Hordeum vulgare subsp. vulgare TaxID=112509 RepID=A0A8I6Y1A7_HORVV|nr:pentatricopeptide repeat-containing protein At3g29290 [Hordeum vulgare subsp. vulgare]
MAAVWSGCSTSRGSFSQELPRRSVKGGQGTRIRPGTGGRSRGDARLVSVGVVMARGACVCRAAPCVLESDVTGQEEAGLGIRGVEDERPGAAGFDYHQRHGLRRRPARPPAVEKDPVRARSVPSASVSEPVDKFEREGSRLHFLEERDEELLSRRLMKLSQTNKVRSAIELFDSMLASGLQPNSHACNSLLASFVRRGSSVDAMKMYEFMKGKGLATGHTYTLILKAVARTEGYISALQMFSEIEECNESRETLDVIVYNTMISACGRAKDWRQVEKLWGRLAENSLSGTLMTYDLLVSTFVQCGQSELAIAAYEEMLCDGLDPSEDIMKAIIASCTKEGRWEFALATFRRMLSAGMKPNIIVFNSVINSLGKAGEDELAFRMYHLLTSSGLEPDQYTWSALLSALYRSGRCWDALELFQGIKSKHPSVLNTHLYNIALMSCERLGQWEHALQLLWMMEKSELQISAVSYNHVIRACEIACEPKVALKVYHRMTHERCSPDTFTHLSVIRACIWGSLWDEVEDILEEVAPDSSVYNTVIHGLCLRGKIRLARKVYTKMRSIGLTPDGKTRSFMLQHIASAE